MGKKEKKNKIGIKTSRFYTKQCIKCRYEYPNWFTQCPKCGTAWDDSEKEKISVETITKTIKIVVKITEEDFNEAINNVQLNFSGDHGKTWYQTKMEFKMDYFIAEITEVPSGSVIIYYIEVHLTDGKKYIENNNGQYFYYKVGASIEESEDVPSESESQVIQNNVTQSTPIPQKYNDMTNSTQQIKDKTLFGNQLNINSPDLIVCPHCNSKIKKTWRTCPICGFKL